MMNSRFILDMKQVSRLLKKLFCPSQLSWSLLYMAVHQSKDFGTFL